MSQPWERQAGETAKAYAAFCVYRDMPPDARSVRDVAQQLDKSSTHIGNWSSKYRWVERVAAFDKHEQAAEIARVREARLQHEAYLAEKRRALVDTELGDYEKQLTKWREVYDKTPLHVRLDEKMTEDGKTKVITVALKPIDWLRLTQWRDRVSRQGRRALGMPDSIKESHITGDVGLSWADVIQAAQDYDDERDGNAPRPKEDW